MYSSGFASSSTSLTGLGPANVDASNVVSAHEQASADLVLHLQNLAKSKRITAQMTTLLTSFDERLARLDKSVVPIHRSTKDLSKIQRNVEAALLAIDAVVGTNDLVDREQEVIDGDPREDLQGYMSSLTRLKSALQSMDKSAAGGASPVLVPGFGNNKGKEREGTLGRIRDLVEVGCGKIQELFLNAVQEASPKNGWADIVSWEEGTPFPTLLQESTHNELTSLLGFIQSILGPNSQLEKDIQRGYGEIRGMFMASTLNHVAREAIDGIEVQTRARTFAAGALPAIGRRGFGRFIDAMFAMAKSEHALAGTLFEKHLANYVYRFIIPPPLAVFTATGTMINTALKKSSTNATNAGIAITCFVEVNLPSRIDNFEDWIRSKAGRKDNELAQASHSFKGSCLRSLTEILDECKVYGSKQLAGSEQTNAGISPMTVNAVNFAKQLCEVPETVEVLLAALGDGNWLPSGKTPSNPGGTKDRDVGGLILLPKYLSDLIGVVLQALDSRAKSLGSLRANTSTSATSVLKKDAGTAASSSRQAAALSAIFMLNNISYLRREFLLNSNVPDLLSGSSRRASASTTAGTPLNGTEFNVEDELNKRNRLAKTNYLEIFSPLVSCLMDAGVEQSMIKSAIGVGNTEKKDTKDRFLRFNESLEEIENLHARLPNCKIDKNEESTKDRIKDEVIRMCVPTYAAFVKRHDNFSKNPSKYLKITPAGLTTRLEKLFA